MTDADRRVTLPTGERQYHIDLAPGELAEYILLPGDPERTDRIATMLEDIEVHRRAPGVRLGHRHVQGPAGLRGLHGHRHGQRGDRDRGDPRASRSGPRSSASAPAACCATDIALGDLVITQRRGPPGGDHEVLRPRGVPGGRRLRRRRGARRGRRTDRAPGPTWASRPRRPGFYGAQGRPIPQLPIRYPDLADEMAAQGVLNFEMEASALLVLAGPGGLPRRASSAPPIAQRTDGSVP